MNKIITISREFGSGGREIGRRLAEAMKIAYYDQEIVAALIKRTKRQRNMSVIWKKNARFRCSQSQLHAHLVCQQIMLLQKI